MRSKKYTHVRTARKLLKRFPRYDQKLFMNVVTYDESWMHYFGLHRKISNGVWLTKMQEGLYCQKDYQCKEGYVCHIFHS